MLACARTLAVGRARKPFDEDDFARHLVGGEAFGSEGFDRGSVNRCLVVADDERADDRNVAAYADFGAGDFCDAGTRRERSLDFKRRDTIAARIHQLIHAAEVRDVAVRIDGAEIAADEPVATEDFGFLFGTVPIAEHQAWVGAVHSDQAFTSDG